MRFGGVLTPEEADACGIPESMLVAHPPTKMQLQRLRKAAQDAKLRAITTAKRDELANKIAEQIAVALRKKSMEPDPHWPPTP